MQVRMLVSWVGKGVGAFIIKYCMRMRVLLGFDFSVGIHHFYKRREYTFNVLLEYYIIFPF